MTNVEHSLHRRSLRPPARPAAARRVPARLTTAASLALAALAAGAGTAGAQGATRTTPELPRHTVDTRLPAAPGRTVRVDAGDDLQRAIDRARPGDVLALAPGATFRGSFTLPAKDGEGWITIRTAGDAGLPRPGERITPAAAPRLARIVATSQEPAFRALPRAHHYRLMLLEVTAEPRVKRNGGLVRLGTSREAQNTLAEVPHRLILDRVYVHGHPAMHLKRCVELNSAWSAVVDSYLSECHGRGQDTQAILGWNGPGPFKIENNRLEGAGENVMFGGSDPSIPDLVPSDIEIRGNHIVKPRAWDGRWTVKNLVELKNAQRVLVEGNVLEGSWKDGQVGFAIVLKSVNQNGRCDWCVTRHVTVRWNTVRDAAGGIAMSGAVNNGHRPGEWLNNVLVADNYFDVGSASPKAVGRFLQMSGHLWNITIERNTVLATKAVLAPGNGRQRNVYVADNVFGGSRYAVKGQGARAGQATMERYWDGYSFVGNALVGERAAAYPPRNFFPATQRDAARLTGSAGRRVGADEAAVRALTRPPAGGR